MTYAYVHKEVYALDLKYKLGSFLTVHSQPIFFFFFIEKKEKTIYFWNACPCGYNFKKKKKKESFDNAKWWINEVQTREGKHVVIALAGNKVDLEESRQITTQEGEQYANDNQFIFFETSAKTNANIKEIFKAVGIISFLFFFSHPSQT
ncbi:Rab5 [Reticulomyxa filosa]|uniref:Rab5 n=1 Tax=Reticulomyxa filosa TaxID=46433 RepID=X6M176_RETFI|nr:Rab5 [Reticulomyxa filosa]|eukprot:ETO06740.1 Rab5 [Reticulomyxa filosa]